MNPKDINVCDLINILAWNRVIRIETLSDKILWVEIANRIPEDLYEYDVYEIANLGDTFIIKVTIKRR